MIRRLLLLIIWSPRRIALWIVLLASITAMVLYLKRGDLSNYLENYHTRNNLREEVARLKAEAKALERERDDLAKGGFEVERVARERFHLSRPGEIVLHLNTPNEDDSSITLRQNPATP